MPTRSNTSVLFLNRSIWQTDDLMALSASINTPRGIKPSAGGSGSDSMSSFEIGDRVEILGENVTDFGSRMGVVTAIRTDSFRTYFKVRLASGAELVFNGSELEIPPTIFADMIFDSHVSAAGSPDSASEHRMRFVCREFDIYVKLMGFNKDKSLSGRIFANDVTPELSLITLLFDSAPFVTTATDTHGKFRLDQIPSGKATLEIMVPSYRIVATFM
jgi:hypothetical protein